MHGRLHMYMNVHRIQVSSTIWCVHQAFRSFEINAWRHGARCISNDQRERRLHCSGELNVRGGPSVLPRRDAQTIQVRGSGLHVITATGI